MKTQQETLFSLHKTNSPEETGALAEQMAALLKPQDVIFLKGDLGAGKSTFARALIQSLCGKSTEVPSPTFTLVQMYETPNFPLWHFDLYRLENETDLCELGFEEAYQAGVSLIEWPERLSLLPPTWIEIVFAPGEGGEGRTLQITKKEKNHKKLNQKSMRFFLSPEGKNDESH